VLKGVVIAAIVGAAIIGIFFVGLPQFNKTPEDQLSQALDQVQSGLTYDKFVNMVDSQRDAIVSKMDPKTIDMVLQEAKKFPTTVSESMQSMESQISSGTQTVVYSKQGQFVGFNGNDAAGKAFVISLGKIAFLRFENFTVTNGPNLHVYMTQGGDISTGIDLGQLKGSTGDQNYALNGVDTKTYDTVVIYCQPFHIYYAEAKLS
jgi:Electron transfer DM13